MLVVAMALCHQFICTRAFDGEWGNKGFGSYSKGYEVALPEWTRFLNALDRLRIERKMTILALTHTKVKSFKNPEGQITTATNRTCMRRPGDCRISGLEENES